MNFIKSFHIKRFFYFILFFCLSPQVSCQRQLSPQAINAIDLFEHKNFAQAYKNFKSLLEKYPKDPLYQFYNGACLVELIQSNDEALFFLKAISTKVVHSKQFYYLGKAYYNEFQFQEALEAYKKMQTSGRRIEIKEVGLFDEMQRVNRASEFFSSAINYNVLSKTKISIDSIQSALVSYLKPSTDKLSEGAIEYRLKNDLNDAHFISILSKNGTNKDIYMFFVEKDGTIKDLKNLSTINTDKDEDFAIFDSKQKRLYFASKGHNSAGGYDIFFSNFHAGNFSKPEQLPFPINTPWDDFLFIPGEQQQIFLSKRKCNAGQAMIYNISPYQQADTVELSSKEEIKEFLDKPAKAKANSIITKTPEKTTEQAIEIISENERQQLIAKSLFYQKSADSLLFLARKIKTELHTTDDKDNRNRMFANISRLEKKSQQYQGQANEIYSKILGSTSQNLVQNTDSPKSATPKTEFASGKQAFYSKKNPVPFDVVLPKGIVYRIQLGAFSKQIEYEKFGGISPISAESLQDGKIIKYYAGIFAQYDEAEKALKSVKDSGFKEAFIVSYFDNKKIPVERAKDMEK